MEQPIKATIKQLHVDDLDAYYCQACWEKSLQLKPLGKHEEYEVIPEGEIWCMFNLTHK